jgi:hypothetical protein
MWKLRVLFHYRYVHERLQFSEFTINFGGSALWLFSDDGTFDIYYLHQNKTPLLLSKSSCGADDDRRSF